MTPEKTSEAELTEAYTDLQRSRERYHTLRRARPLPPVGEYTFAGTGGEAVTLRDLFGAQDDLLVIHNMGTGCAYCTMWADEFNGALAYLEDRAAFVVISPDDPATQARFAASRGWRFRMASSQGTTFRADMGFEADGSLLPGVTAFHRAADGTITATGSDVFGPGDDYCAPWHLFDLLPGGSEGWEAHYQLVSRPEAAPPLIDAVATACLFVHDQDAALAFYTQKLGFELRQDSPMGPSRWIAVAPRGARTELILYQVDDNWQHYRGVVGQSQAFTFNVTDMAALVDDLRAKGVRFVQEPTPQPWGTFAMILDDEDNRLILVETPKG